MKALRGTLQLEMVQALGWDLLAWLSSDAEVRSSGLAARGLAGGRRGRGHRYAGEEAEKSRVKARARRLSTGVGGLRAHTRRAWVAEAGGKGGRV